MLEAKRGELAAEAQVAGVKGWLPGGGGVASMAAVTGTGLEGPGRGWGGGRRGGPEAARGLRLPAWPRLRRGLPGAPRREDAGKSCGGMERGGEKR